MDNAERACPLLWPIIKRVTCSDLLEQMATDGQREAGLDIADFLLEEDTPKMKLARMIELNPEVQSLLDDFGLEMTDAGQK